MSKTATVEHVSRKREMDWAKKYRTTSLQSEGKRWRWEEKVIGRGDESEAKSSFLAQSSALVSFK